MCYIEFSYFLGVCMRKIIFVLLIAMVLFAGCSNKLKAGVYEAENVLPDSTATVKVTIDKDGKITDVYFDETYDGSTKKAFGDDYDEDSEKTEKYVQQLEYYDEQIENAKVRETGMTRYVREGYERIMDAKEERLPEIKADLEQRLANEQQTLERYNKMKPKNKIYKDSLEVNKWAAQRNIDEYLGGLKAINERMGKK